MPKDTQHISWCPAVAEVGLKKCEVEAAAYVVVVHIADPLEARLELGGASCQGDSACGCQVGGALEPPGVGAGRQRRHVNREEAGGVGRYEAGVVDLCNR